MKLNTLFKMITLLLPIIVAFSCGFPKEKFNKENTATVVNKNINNKDKPLINCSENTFEEQLDKLKKENVVNFSFNNYKIDSQYSKSLNNLSKFLCRYPNQKIIIEGHTDNRGTIQYNMKLGQKRADSIKLYLENKGVSDQQISTVSYGQSKPVATGDTEEIYEKNRRSVIIYQQN